MKPYENYTQINEKWFAKYPSHWEVKRIKEIFNQRNERNDPVKTINILSLSAKNGVLPVSEKTDKGGNKPKEDITKYNVARENDLLVNCMNIVSGAAGVSKWDGAISPVYYALFPRTEQINIWFYHNIFRLSSFQKSLLGLGKGILMIESNSGNLNTVRMRIPMSNLNNVMLPVPPRTEQDQIVRFLDWKLSKIDKLIKAKKKQIELLKEQKQAIINKAVTKGLDDSVPMKDSGVAWIGEVPENYQICKLKNLGTFKSGLNLTSFDINDTGMYPVYGGNGLRGYFSKFTHSGEYLLIGRQGALCGNVHFVYGDFWATEHAITVQPSLISNIKWLYYLVMVMNLNQYSTAAAQPGISVEKIIALYTIVPSLEEQQTIVTYLKEKTAIIDQAIAIIEKELELVSEYKTSLISSVVTGKVDVRDIIVPEFEAEELIKDESDDESEDIERMEE